MSKSVKEDTKDQIVIFVHIPKTAGTTLRNIIERNFDKQAIFAIDGRDPQKSIEIFNSLSLEKKASFSLVQGHVAFGAIKNLPHKQIKHITFLRDPVERVLSYYSYILSDSFRRPQAEIAENMSLKNYLLSKCDWQMNNHQTRMIAGSVPPDYGACDEKVLERAKNNLIKYFHFIGIAEHFDESILLMSKSLGWKIPFYRRLNITRKRITQDTIDEEEKYLIMKENSFDLQLYEFIRSRFESLPKRPFHIEVKMFQIINKINFCMWIPNSFKRLIFKHNATKN